MAVKREAASVIEVPRANIQNLTLTIRGIGAGLLVHRFHDIDALGEKGQGKAQTVKPARNYEQEFNDARYVIDGKDCYPADALKKAVVGACSFVDGVFKTHARGAFFPLDEFFQILGPSPVMHRCVVWIGRGTSRVAMVRVRPLYRNWKMNIRMRYDANIISTEQLVFLFVQAGFSVGLGDWRPQKDGQFGMFEVERNGN